MFESESDRERNEALAGEVTDMIDSMDHPFKAQKMLAICSLADLGVFIMAFFAPQSISKFAFETQIYLSMIIFTLGFFIGYGLIKLYDFFYTNRGPEMKTIDPDFMGGYQYVEQQNHKWVIWLLAAAAGAVNVTLFFVLIGLRLNKVINFSIS